GQMVETFFTPKGVSHISPRVATVGGFRSYPGSVVSQNPTTLKAVASSARLVNLQATSINVVMFSNVPTCSNSIRSISAIHRRFEGILLGRFGVRHSTEQTPQHPIQRRHPVSQPNRHVFVQRISKNEPKAGRAMPIAMPFLQIMDG